MASCQALELNLLQKPVLLLKEWFGSLFVKVRS